MALLVTTDEGGEVLVNPSAVQYVRRYVARVPTVDFGMTGGLTVRAEGIRSDQWNRIKTTLANAWASNVNTTPAA